MIKVNIIINEAAWKKKIRNPYKFIKNKIKKLSKIRSFEYKSQEFSILLTNNNIECRPIVSGNFLKNKAVLEYFDYRVCGTLPNAENLDEKGLFIGNHHFNIKENIKFLINLLKI